MNCSCFMEHPQTKQGEPLQMKDLTWESQASKEGMVHVLTLLTAHANQISTQEVVRSGLSWYVESWWGVLSSKKKRTMTLLVPQYYLLKIQMTDDTVRSLLNRVSSMMDLRCIMSTLCSVRVRFTQISSSISRCIRDLKFSPFWQTNRLGPENSTLKT